MLKRLIIAAAVVTLGGCAEGPFVQKPPPRYRETGTFIIKTAKTEAVPAVCAAAAVPGPSHQPANTVGCASGSVAVLPNPCEWPDPYAQIVCHELAHLQGWGSGHPR